MVKTKTVTVIAEIGISHGGNMSHATNSIYAAKMAGANIAKFQWYRADEVLGADSPFFDEANRAQFTREQHEELKAYCETLGIEWGCSIFHPDQVELVEDMGIKRYKVASRSMRDVPLLHEIAKTGKPVLLSTGGHTLIDIEESLKELRRNDVTLLHCVPMYPTPLEYVDLHRLKMLKAFGKPLGFSSHCPAVAPTLAAVMAGAEVVENHVAFPGYKGCDAASSIGFDRLEELVTSIREMEALHD